MKLASYKDGSRDGQLVVVSRDLSQAHYASHIASRLQQVLDDWNYLSPQLQDLYDSLNSGRTRHAFPFDPAQCLAPLPRAYQWAVGATDEANEPQMTQKASDDLAGACAPIVCASEESGIDFEAEVAVITGDIPMACPADRALDGIRLVMLANVVYLRHPTPADLATAFSPVAITLDELGEAWSKGRVHLPLQRTWNGRKLDRRDAGTDARAHFGQLIARLCKTRNIRAGSIVGTGPLSKPGVEETSRTDSLKYGDTIRIEMKGSDGQSLFGAIEQEVVPLVRR
jgi:fumarylacetoacetate (FAA) hydrolase